MSPENDDLSSLDVEKGGSKQACSPGKLLIIGPVVGVVLLLGLGVALGLVLGLNHSEEITPMDSYDPTDHESYYLTKIDAIYFAQTHVFKIDDPYFVLSADRETLVKVHVLANATTTTVRSTPVNMVLTHPILGTNQIRLTGPQFLPLYIETAIGVVNHTFENSFTGYISREWMSPGLSVEIRAGASTIMVANLSIGAPTKVIMTMFDVQYFEDTDGDYSAGWDIELGEKWPVSELIVRRIPHVIFPELVIPARAGVSVVRVHSKDDYLAQTGLGFDGEQGAALQWKSALKAAAGTSGRWSLYYVNIYNVWAGGQAGGYGGVGCGTCIGILNHELGHALGLPHWGDNSGYPYKGDMYGITAPDNYMQTHVGPTWAFSVYEKRFIPPTVGNNTAKGTYGTYKCDPMQGGGEGDQEDPPFLMRHFSDYSIKRMYDYTVGHVVAWNEDANSFARYNSDDEGYTDIMTNNGVQFPVTRDVSVISIMASISGCKTDVNMVYPPIGPYTSGLIKLFDPTHAHEREEADSIYCPTDGCDLSLRITQGGVLKVYLLAAVWDTDADPLSGGALTTKAINVPAADGSVTKAELLLTPDAEINGISPGATVLYTWPNL